MKYKIITLGCKVNSYESESYKILLESRGYLESFSDTADIIIVNTCSVTSTSDQKSRQMIHRMHKANPNSLLIVVGCYSQVSYESIKDIEGVNIVIGSKYKNELLDLIDEYNNTHQQIVKVENSREFNLYEEIKVTSYNDNTRAFLKIQDGCNNFCSYCLIPYTRGKARSRKPIDVINEAKILVENGFKEIVLTGIHTAGYGLDFENYTFTDLLKELVKIDGLERLRISSIEESEISDEFIDLLNSSKSIVPHLHIPLQSGCDETLKRMNRKYNCEQFYNTITKIRSLVPNICITTDVIVGFPGETNEEFNKTYEFIKRVNFNMLHVFPYSVRSGTVAAKMKDQIDPKIKKERVNTLIELNNELANNYINNYQDKVLDVLFETYENGLIRGHGENYFMVECEGDESYLNKIKQVKITKPGYPKSFGIIIK